MGFLGFGVWCWGFGVFGFGFLASQHGEVAHAMAWALVLWSRGAEQLHRFSGVSQFGMCSADIRSPSKGF